jgi:glycosyltransferase involved in cell wall biosynthesis
LELSKFGFQCDVIPSINSRNFFSFPTSDFINAINGDLFVSHNPYHGIYGGSKAKKRNRIKYLSLRLKADYWVESSSNIVPLKNRLGFKLKLYQNSKAIDDVDFIISISDWVKKTAIKNGLEQNIYTIHNGVDIEKFQNVGFYENYKSDILCVMNFNIPEKIKALYEFISLYKERKLNYVITFVGDGMFFNQVNKKIQELKLNDVLKLKGWVNDIEKYYSSSDLVIHPSGLDAFPTSLLEAGAASKSVVATNIGGIPEIISNNISGYLSNNMSKFLDNIENLMTDNDLRTKMGQEAHKIISTKFTWEKSAQDLIKMLKSEGIING